MVDLQEYCVDSVENVKLKDVVDISHEQKLTYRQEIYQIEGIRSS